MAWVSGERIDMFQFPWTRIRKILVNNEGVPSSSRILDIEKCQIMGARVVDRLLLLHWIIQSGRENHICSHNAI